MTIASRNKITLHVRTLGLALALLGSLCACSVSQDGSKAFTPALASVCVVDRGNIWVVSEKGDLIHFDNGRVAEPKFTSEAAAVEFVNKDIGWTLMRTGRLFQTRNGGMDWEEIGQLEPLAMGTHPFSYPLKIKFVDDKVGWLSVSEAIFRTDDGGKTWRVSKFPRAPGIGEIAIIGRSELWAVDWTGKVFHTTDGGENWEVKQLQVEGVGESYPRSVAVDRAGRVWVGSLRSRSILDVSNDGGQTWSERELPVTSDIVQLTAIQFAPDGTGRASFVLSSKTDAPTRYVILISEDNGETWKASSDVSIPFRPFEIKFISATEGYLIGASTIAVTNDAGVTWQTLLSIDTASKV